MKAMGLVLLYCTSARMAEMAMNTTMRTRMQSTWLLSLIFFTTVPRMKSIVSVEDDVITSDERVLIEADSTSTTTRAMSMGESPSSIFGIIASKPPAGTPLSPTFSTSEKRRPNPPRK